MSRTWRRFLPAAAILVAAMPWLLLVRPTAAERPVRPPLVKDVAEPADRPTERLREGTRFIDEVGHFKSTGDRITFYQHAGDRRYQVLENLALDRIASLVGETPDPLEWVVTGTITEYRGANFLFVTRSTLKSRTESRPER